MSEPRRYAVRDFEPTVNPPESIEEMGERLMALERHVLRRAGRPSELRNRVDRIEGVLTEKGILRNDHGEPERSGGAGRETE